MGVPQRKYLDTLQGSTKEFPRVNNLTLFRVVARSFPRVDRLTAIREVARIGIFESEDIRQMTMTV